MITFESRFSGLGRELDPGESCSSGTDCCCCNDGLLDNDWFDPDDDRELHDRAVSEAGPLCNELIWTSVDGGDSDLNGFGMELISDLLSLFIDDDDELDSSWKLASMSLL